MAVIATISSSPSRTSRTEAVLADLGRRVQRAGHVITPIVLRDLPAEPLLRADTDDDAIARASCTLQQADAVIVSTPVYKAAYSGLLKAFLDLLPQTALRGKTVLPIATGGSPAHVLAVDYALRPVLASLAPSAITPGWFVLASEVTLHEGGDVTIAESAASRWTTSPGSSSTPSPVARSSWPPTRPTAASSLSEPRRWPDVEPPHPSSHPPARHGRPRRRLGTSRRLRPSR